IAEIVKISVDQLMRQISCLKMKRRFDAVKIDRGILKSRARAQRPPQDRRARNDIRELPADTHDLIGIGDSLEILPMSDVHIRGLGRHDRADLTRFESRANDERTIAPESRIDEILGETLRLRLHANEEAHAADHAT